MPLPESISKIPPKRLALIAVGGIGAGLLWRHYANRNTPASTQLDSSGNPIDLTKFALGENSAGNLAAGGLAGVPSSNDATRDFGSTFPLPITKGVITGADGIDYYIGPDGTIIGPVNPTVTVNGQTLTQILAAEEAAAQAAKHAQATTPFDTPAGTFNPTGPLLTDAYGNTYDPRYFVDVPGQSEPVPIAQFLGLTTPTRPRRV